jgi:hypothetical protein
MDRATIASIFAVPESMLYPPPRRTLDAHCVGPVGSGLEEAVLRVLCLNESRTAANVAVDSGVFVSEARARWWLQQFAARGLVRLVDGGWRKMLSI